jgi:hypothetical protein
MARETASILEEIIIMEFNYDNMVAFMESYFKEFSIYGQDPKTQYRLNEYFAPELEFVPYLKDHPRIQSREHFYKAMVHPAIQETLTLGELVVDDRRGVVDALVKTELKHKETGEIKVLAWFNAIYQLKFDENKTIKIKKILFFFECKPETANVLEIIKSA